ncbi:MAG: hypothetical protein GY932_04530 [Arcobacter sp.]|nr:hypothetical protein [Arcobacter sp.]
MKSIIKVFFVNILFISALFAEVGIVNTHVLLIKKEPSSTSVKFGFYRMNDSIEVLSEEQGLDNEYRWFKTSRGYVKADYVILEKDLPQFLDDSQVDFTKNALQLIVYQTSAVGHLKNLRIKLRNENNLYKRKSKNVYVIYLTNFNSYSEALQKKKELAYEFPGSFIIKIKQKNNSQVKTKKTKKTKNIKKEEKVSSKKYIKKEKRRVIPKKQSNEEFDLENSKSDFMSEDISLEEINELNNIENRKNVIIEEFEPEEESYRSVVKKNKRKNIIKKTIKKKVVKKENVPKKDIGIKEKSEKSSFNFLLENVLINLNEEK